MDYRKYGDTYYIRFDRGDEIISGIIDVCRKEEIHSSVYSGIGGCESAEIQTCNPAIGQFDIHRVQGMLELVSLNGNVMLNADDKLTHHTHAVFSYQEKGDHRVIAGHIKSATVLYTAEIELRPVVGGEIRRSYDKQNGTRFWNFTD